MNKKKEEPEETALKESQVITSDEVEKVEDVLEEPDETPAIQPEMLISPEAMEALFRGDPEKNRNRR